MQETPKASLARVMGLQFFTASMTSKKSSKHISLKKPAKLSELSMSAARKSARARDRKTADNISSNSVLQTVGQSEKIQKMEETIQQLIEMQEQEQEAQDFQEAQEAQEQEAQDFQEAQEKKAQEQDAQDFQEAQEQEAQEQEAQDFQAAPQAAPPASSVDYSQVQDAPRFSRSEFLSPKFKFRDKIPNYLTQEQEAQEQEAQDFQAAPQAAPPASSVDYSQVQDATRFSRSEFLSPKFKFRDKMPNYPGLRPCSCPSSQKSNNTAAQHSSETENQFCRKQVFKSSHEPKFRAKWEIVDSTGGEYRK